MKQLCLFGICIVFLFSCGSKDTFIPRNFNHVNIETIYSDSILSIRAIDILDDGSLAFAANESVLDCTILERICGKHLYKIMIL